MLRISYLIYRLKINSVKLNLLTTSLIVIFTSTIFAEKKTIDLDALRTKLTAAVKAGELTRKEAVQKFNEMKSGKSSDSSMALNGFFLGGKVDEDGQYQASFILAGKGQDKSKWPVVTFTGKSFESRFSDLQKSDAVVINLGDGTASKSAEKKGENKKGKQLVMSKSKGKGGNTNFYSIVIGRLKSKDIELGEFTMEVDYATLNRYNNAWVKDEIMGKTVKVTGVSGQFRDNLLLIRKGQTLKVRTGGYSAASKTLSFAHKFNVLERAVPFSPDAHGVPPESFRGFGGVIKGKILEASGYEVLLLAEEIVSVEDSNKASDADSIKGKRVRISGFFNDHADKFNSLQTSDTLRVGIQHRNRVFDMFDVTDVLEIVEP